MELKENEIQEYIHDMYRSVVKSFVDIFDMKEDEIKIRYKKDMDGTASYHHILHTRAAKILLKSDFFYLSKEEQKGLMAHEIGHHIEYKECSIPKLKRKAKWSRMYEGSRKIPDSRPHWRKRIEKWGILNEMAADNNAVKAGFGKQILERYKRLYSEYNDYSNFGKKRLDKYHKVLEKMLANLEQKLEVGK